MSFRYSDLVIDLSDFARRDPGCPEITARPTGFCPTASATIGVVEAAPLNLDILRDQLRAALGR